MSERTGFTENVDTLFSDLQNFIKTESILGTPLTVEDKTLIPLISVTLGYGSTGMNTKAQIGVNTNSSSGGHGLGAKVSTNGVVVIDRGTVQILSINENSKLGQMMEKIPQALAGVGQNMMETHNQVHQGSIHNQQYPGQNVQTSQRGENGQ